MQGMQGMQIFDRLIEKILSKLAPTNPNLSGNVALACQETNDKSADIYSHNQPSKNSLFLQPFGAISQVNKRFIGCSSLFAFFINAQTTTGETGS
ncbi:MAG: hypothetical protein ACR5K7_03630 [Symbiopectobacterium sp.]